MNKNKKLWIGIISLTLAILLFAILLIVRSSMQEEPEYKTVLCAKTSISEDMQITQKNAEQYLEEKAVPSEWLPEDYITEWKQIYDMVLKTDISAGTVMTRSMVTAYHELYANYRQLTWISVPIKELFQGVAGSLRIGDYVDIYSICQAEDQYQCNLLAERVRIEDSYNIQGVAVDENSPDGLTQLIVIPMEKEQVAAFYEKLAQGNIRVAKYEG